MAEYDNKAFDAMKEGTSKPSDRLFEGGRVFTESEYNMNATHKERMDYDAKAYGYLQELFKEDKIKHSDIRDWDFNRYLANLKNSYLEEKFAHSKEGDPDYYSKAGEMLSSIYSDDVEQLKLSAFNVEAQNVPIEEGDEFRPSKRERSNVSIKAPGAESY